MKELEQFKDLDDKNLLRWNFPGGEVGTRLRPTAPDSVIWRMQNSDDVMAFILAAATKPEGAFKKVFIPYMPYARQDRVATEGDQIAIDVLAGLIGSTGVQEVWTLDAHSDATRQAFENHGMTFVNVSPVEFIKLFMTQHKMDPAKTVFVSPDKGAIEKTIEYAKALGVNKMVFCDKVRNPNDGKITHFEVSRVEGEIIADLQALIVDDICDGGRTFFGVKKAVIEKCPIQDVSLWTSHGIYSAGLDNLTKEFKVVGSTDSFRSKYFHEKQTVIPLLEHVYKCAGE